MYAAEPELLDALAARLLAAQGPVPAAALATEFGCTSAGMAGMVSTLRGFGADIREVADGYVFVLDDRLDAAAIRAALPKGLRLNVGVKQVCESTNEAVRSLPAPALCVAEMQTAGRGRRARSWAQPFGAGLPLSLAAPVPRGRVDPLAIALALAAVRRLEASGYGGIRIKWPNDLFVRDAKLGGLMVEVDGGAQARLRAGLGINVHAAPAGLGRKAATLAEPGSSPDRNRLAAALGAALMDALQRYEVEGFAPFAEMFPEFDWLLNRRVTLSGPSGTLQGVARGVDGSGALVLDTAQGRKLCRAGEVSIGNPAEAVT